MSALRIEENALQNPQHAAIVQRVADRPWASLDGAYQELRHRLGHLYFVYRGGKHIAIHQDQQSEPRLVLIVEMDFAPAVQS